MRFRKYIVFFSLRGNIKFISTRLPVQSDNSWEYHPRILSQISATEDKKVASAQETYDNTKNKAIAETAPKEDKVPQKAEAKNKIEKTAAKIDKAAADNAEANKKLNPGELPKTDLKPDEKNGAGGKAGDKAGDKKSAADKPVE